MCRVGFAHIVIIEKSHIYTWRKTESPQVCYRVVFSRRRKKKSCGKGIVLIYFILLVAKWKLLSNKNTISNFFIDKYKKHFSFHKNNQLSIQYLNKIEKYTKEQQWYSNSTSTSMCKIWQQKEIPLQLIFFLSSPDICCLM